MSTEIRLETSLKCSYQKGSCSGLVIPNFALCVCGEFAIRCNFGRGWFLKLQGQRGGGRGTGGRGRGRVHSHLRPHPSTGLYKIIVYIILTATYDHFSHGLVCQKGSKLEHHFVECRGRAVWLTGTQVLGVSSTMWVRIPAVTLVSLSKTLNHNCFSPPRG